MKKLKSMKSMKKLLVTTLAATLVVSSMAVVPFNNRDSASKFGISVASAAALPQTTIDKIARVKAYVLPEDLAAVDAAQNALKNLTDTTLVSDIMTPINAAKTRDAGHIAVNAGGGYNLITAGNILELFKRIGMINYADATGLEAFRTDTTLRPVMDQLAKLGSSDPMAPIDLTPDDFVIFFDRVLLLIQSSGFSSLAEANMKSYIVTKILAVIDENNNKISNIFNNITGLKNQLKTMSDKMDAAVDPNGAARKAMMIAFVRSMVVHSNSNVTSRSAVPVLTVNGIVIPNDFLVATQTLGSPDIILSTGNTFTLNSSIPEGASRTAGFTLNVFGKLLYTGAITLTAPVTPTVVDPPTTTASPTPVVTPTTTPTATPSPTASPVASATPTPTIGPIVTPDPGQGSTTINNTATEIAVIFAKLGLDDLQVAARDAIEESIREASTINLSQTVVTTNNVATLSLNAAAFDAIFANVKKFEAEGNAVLQKIAPGALPVDVVVQLDLGVVNAKTVEFPIGIDLLTKAIANGIDAIAIKVNGISLAIDSDQLKTNTTLSIVKELKSAASTSTSQTLASDVFSFDFTANGVKKTEFEKAVEVRIPLPDITGLDNELLVLAKVVNGVLIPKGGQSSKDKKEFIAQNKSFSTYVVLENKISFKDTKSVEEWAGRQIQVIASKGIIEGRGQAMYAPNENVTRAEFAKMIVKYFNLEDVTAVNPFSDVKSSDWFVNYVAAAAKARLIMGREDGSFDPNASITRAEMATIASRALTSVRGYKSEPDALQDLKVFVDADSISTGLKDGVALAARLGVVIGQSNKMFNPNSNSTRAEAAVVIHRLLSK